MYDLTTILTKFQVTDEQVSKAHRVEDLTKKVIFYQVESQTTFGVEYKVYFDQAHKVLTCTCPAGNEGRNCWHKRAAVAHAEEQRQIKIERQEQDMIALAQEMAEEARAASPYTVIVDETSNSLDGRTFETAPSGRLVPMN